MEELNAEKIKKLKHGETAGAVATVVCGVITAAFAVCFIIAQVKNISTLKTVSTIVFPILIAAAIGIAAYCNLKYGVKLNKVIKSRVKDALIENAALMHPDRSELTFGVSVNDTFAEIKVNNFKETIKIDFSVFGKLSSIKKAAVTEAIAERLNITFCRLYERGVNYSTVSYFYANPGKKKKVVFIIEGGQPDKRAYKTYLKTN